MGWPAACIGDDALYELSLARCPDTYLFTVLSAVPMRLQGVAPEQPYENCPPQQTRTARSDPKTPPNGKTPLGTAFNSPHTPASIMPITAAYTHLYHGETMKALFNPKTLDAICRLVVTMQRHPIGAGLFLAMVLTVAATFAAPFL